MGGRGEESARRPRRRCLCGSADVRAWIARLSLDFPRSGVTASAAVPALRCGCCERVHVEPCTLERLRLVVGCELANLGVLTGEAFRHMRRALGLRACDVAQLLDLTPETISHWETGKARPNRAAFVALAAMLQDAVDRRTITRDRLGRLVEGRPPPPSLTLELR
jgi:DNA-binding XRE family transcriptional regulator